MPSKAESLTPIKMDPLGTPDPPFRVVKITNEGLSVATSEDGEFTAVMTVSRTRFTIGEQFSVWIGKLSLETFVRNVIVNVLQVDQLFKNIVITLLSKWFKFNDDGSLEIKGNVQMNGTAKVINDFSIVKNLNVEGESVFKDDVQINNDITVSNSLKVDGTSEFNEKVKMTDSVVLNNAKVIGKARFTDNVSVKGSITTYGGIHTRDNPDDDDNDHSDEEHHCENEDDKEHEKEHEYHEAEPTNL